MPLKKISSENSSNTGNNLMDMSINEINDELDKGGKFVVYQYCISVFVLTFKRSSKIFFIKTGENKIKNGVIYTLISLLFGWWGFPWGPIYTIGSVITNLKGGKDVTYEVISASNSSVNDESLQN